MTLEFHASNISKFDISTLDCLIETIKHELAMTVISGVKTDSLSSWCQCHDRGTGAQLPLVIWKYYHQAQHFFKIGAFAPEMVPTYLISMQDLTPSLLCELADLSYEDRNFVLKQAVGAIFEDINSRLYHISVSKLLEVALID